MNSFVHYGASPDLLRKGNYKEVLAAEVQRLEKHFTWRDYISSDGGFWSLPLQHIVDGKVVVGPVPEDQRNNYQSINPIRPVIDTYVTPRSNVDGLGERLLATYKAYQHVTDVRAYNQRFKTSAWTRFKFRISRHLPSRLQRFCF